MKKGSEVKGNNIWMLDLYLQVLIMGGVFDGLSAGYRMGCAWANSNEEREVIIQGLSSNKSVVIVLDLGRCKQFSRLHEYSYAS